jgi:hypothetical protein
MKLRKEKYGKHTIYRNDWMEFCTGWHKLAFKIAPASYFDNRLMIQIVPFWGQLFIHIGWIRSKYDECDPPRYGFYFYSIQGPIPTEFVWCWGRKNKTFYMPWSPEWVRTSRMLKDKTWLHEMRGNRKKGIDFDWWKEDVKESLWKETHPYKYVLKDGTVQERTATIKVEEREWRPRWFMWTSLFARKIRSIDIEFNDEVGERTGSWKGGTLGCGWNLLSKESPLECLRRMERERKFN